MKLIAPTLGREEDATLEGIAEVIPLLSAKDDPFAVLKQSELTYVRVLWTPEGYDLEYQEKNTMNHYRVKHVISQQVAITVLQSYLEGNPAWGSELEFEKKDIADLTAKVGFSLGKWCGAIIRGFVEGREGK